MSGSIKVGKVFVPGGMPTYTYNSRSHLNLEDQIDDYLDEGHSILSVSGPTKTGKTVLINRLVTESIRVTGGEVRSLDDLLQYIASDLGIESTIENSVGDEEGDGVATSSKAGLKGILEGQRSKSRSAKSTAGTKRTYSVSLRANAKRALKDNIETLILDDFHYIPPDSQTEIVRYLKDPVFDGLRVIVIAVPHRAYDIVRVEKEMTGRVRKMEIGFWTPQELRQIAIDGFRILNVADPDDLTSTLVEQSFSSPHLMQEFCLRICKDNGVRMASSEGVELREPKQGWKDFFGRIADDASRSAFELLARGPRQRTYRMARKLSSGRQVDIYGLVLAAMASTGPLVEMTYEKIRDAVRDISEGTPPPGHELTRILEKMSEIARDRIEGEPVVEYDKNYRKLHIADPFFAYYLRWGLENGVPRQQ